MINKYAERLRELSKLEHGWYDGDCDPPNEAAMIPAFRFANRVQELGIDPSIFPLYEGGVEFEWDSPTHGFVLSFKNNFDVKYLQVNLNSDDVLQVDLRSKTIDEILQVVKDNT